MATSRRYWSFRKINKEVLWQLVLCIFLAEMAIWELVFMGSHSGGPGQALLLFLGLDEDLLVQLLQPRSKTSW